MDLFTPKSDLDLSVNFNTDTNDQYPRRNKISAIRKLANVLFSHQRNYCSNHISHLSWHFFFVPSRFSYSYPLLELFAQ